MPSLKEAAEQLTGQLEELVEQLRSELTDGEVDFGKLAGVADQIGAAADGLAQTFGDVNDTLMKRIEEVQGGGSGSGGRSQKKAGSRQGRNGGDKESD
jgi:hypothetical protein